MLGAEVCRNGLAGACQKKGVCTRTTTSFELVRPWITAGLLCRMDAHAYSNSAAALPRQHPLSVSNFGRGSSNRPPDRPSPPVHSLSGPSPAASCVTPLRRRPWPDCLRTGAHRIQAPAPRKRAMVSSAVSTSSRSWRSWRRCDSRSRVAWCAAVWLEATARVGQHRWDAARAPLNPRQPTPRSGPSAVAAFRSGRHLARRPSRQSRICLSF